MLSISAIIALLALNGFFVAAEFALVKSRGFRIQSPDHASGPSTQLSLSLQENLEAYLQTCQLGISMASIGLGWLGGTAAAALLEPLFTHLGTPAQWLPAAAFLSGFLLFSSLHIVVGEQLPKALAIRRAGQVSLWVAYPLHWAYLLVWPLNWLLNKTSGGILARIHGQQANRGDVFARAASGDPVATLDLPAAMEAGQADLLRKLLDVDQRTVAQVMIPRERVQTLDLAKSGAENLSVVANSCHSRFPLLDSAQADALIGLVPAMELYRAAQGGRADTWQTPGDFCSQSLLVPERQKITALFDVMRERRVHMALVVDADGRFTGIVTLEDLLQDMMGDMEDARAANTGGGRGRGK